MSATILTVFPERSNVNGDAQNALVLAARARWAGLDAEVLAVRPGEPLPPVPQAVVIGSTVDAELPDFAAALREQAAVVQGWFDAGVPVLAVGTDLELLGESIRLADRTAIEGLAMIDAVAEPAAARISDDLVISGPFGRVLGYENHARLLRLAAEIEPLGDLVYGVGNDGRSEGVLAGPLIGTHLHGPVLAKNPRLADELLVRIYGAAYSAENPGAERADAIARDARAVILRRLGLPGD